MYQKIKRFISPLIFFGNCLLYSSDQEKQYKIGFFTQDLTSQIGDYFTLNQSEVDQIQLIGSIIGDIISVIDQSTNEFIQIPVDNDYQLIIKEYFSDTLLPVIREFIKIKYNNKNDYFDIISLINFIKTTYAHLKYQQFKDIFELTEYLQVNLLIKRAFANVCYDVKPDDLLKKTEKNFKKGYKEPKSEEEVFIDILIKRNKLLISLNDLPIEFKDSHDFISKNLRSLDGIEELIENQYKKDKSSYFYYQRNFNFKQNFIQDIDPLVFLEQHLYEKNIKNCKFIVNLRGQKLSQKAKEQCKKINELIDKNDAFKDRFQNLTESDLISNRWTNNLKLKISNQLQSPLVPLTGFFSSLGLYILLSWKFYTFVSNQITYIGKQTLSPDLFKKFEKIPLKALPFTLLMNKFTFSRYYDQFLPIIDNIVFYPIKKMLNFKSIVNFDELNKLSSICMYILYDN